MKVLVIAAHPDDEALGCGGTIALHAEAGDEVAVLFMTDGVGSRGQNEPALVAERREAMHRAAEILGVSQVKQHDFPDNAMDQVALLAVSKAIEEFCEEWGDPELVFTHHPGDLNIDHEITHRATLTAFRPQPGCAVREIRTFEVPSSTGWRGSSSDKEFRPNIYVDITTTLERKLRALEAYAEEMRPWPHARSLEGVRGSVAAAGSMVGLAAAERFCLERKIER